MNKLILIFIVFCASNFAQNLDSLFIEFTKPKPVLTEIQQQGQIDIQSKPKPILFTTENLVRYHFNNFTEEQQTILAPLLARPIYHTSIVSKSGFFKIHYDTFGVDKPAYDVNALADILDEVYDYQVNQLGYLAPPSDGTLGGDSKYDIYLKNSSVVWGETKIETLRPDNTAISYIVMDSDFSDKRVTGLDAVKITSAHEFHHAIQMGNYVLRFEDVFFHEMTSTAMEEFLYDDVNDYYFEMHYFMNNLQTTLSKSPRSGYDTTIFNLFLKERFGIGIIKEIWEMMRNDRALNAISKAIQNHGSTFKTEFELFSDWIYFTGSRTKQGKYFEEASFYPELKPVNRTVINSDSYNNTMMYFTQSVSNNFVTYIDSTFKPANEITIRITNSDYTSAIVAGDPIQVDLTVSKGEENGIRIAKNYFGNIEAASKTEYIGYQFYFNGNFASDYPDTNNNNLTKFVFPQPYNPVKHSSLLFPVEKNDKNVATLYVYSLSMELLYSSELQIYETSDFPTVRWNGIDNSGNRLSSGVYIFVVDSENILTKGKFAVLND